MCLNSSGTQVLLDHITECEALRDEDGAHHQMRTESCL